MNDEERLVTEPKKSRWPFVVGAGALPVLSIGGSLVLAIILAAMAGGPDRFFAEFWVIHYSVLGFALVSTVFVTVLLVLSALGWRVPAALVMGITTLPWAAASVAIMVTTTGLESVVSDVSPEYRAMMLAQSIAGSLNVRGLGALVTGSLMGSVCIGLGIAALGQRAPNRSWIGALIGFGSASLLLGIAVVLGVISYAGISVALLLLPVAAGVIGTPLAGWGAGDDQPHGRASALAAAAPVALGVACVTAVILVSTRVTVEIFAALGGAAPEMRSAYIARGAEEMAPIRFFETWGAVAFFLPALCVAGWALTRSRPSVGRIVGAVATVIVVVSVFGLDWLALRSASGSLLAAADLPWEEHEGFEPIQFPGRWLEGEADAVVTQTEVVTVTGDRHPVSTLSTAAGVSGLVTQWTKLLPPRPGLDTDPHHRGGRGERLWISPGERGRTEPATVELEPSIAVALDRRLRAAEVRGLVKAASAAGAVSLVLVGATPLESERSYEATIERTRSLAPFLVAFTLTESARRVLLEPALPPRFPHRDAVLYHGAIVAHGPLTLSTRPGSGESAKTIETDRRSRAQRIFGLTHTGETRGEAIPLAYLTIDDASTAADVLVMADAVAESGLQPVLLPGSQPPGDPFKTFPAEPPQGELIGDGRPPLDGREVRGKMKRGRPSIVGGSGGMDPDMIRRTVGRAIGGIKACYERSLRRAPTLMGRLQIEFTINTGGRVSAARVTDSTLPTEVGECVIGRIRSLRFAPPDGGPVTVSYPFFFAPRSG